MNIPAVFIVALVLWCLYKTGRSINGSGYGPGSFVLDLAMAFICFAGTFGVALVLKGVGL